MRFVYTLFIALCFYFVYYFIWILKRAKPQNFNDLEYLCDKKAVIMRNFISQFHRRLCVFLTSYSDAVQREARRKDLATFNKTRFASHRRFLVSCLDKKSGSKWVFVEIPWTVFEVSENCEELFLQSDEG